MKEIKLTNSHKTTTVCDEDFEFLNQFKWKLSKDGYVITKDETFRYMHQAVWYRHHKNFTTNLVIDHINRNKRTNQIWNLREISTIENLRNNFKKGEFPHNVLEHNKEVYKCHK